MLLFEDARNHPEDYTSSQRLGNYFSWGQKIVRFDFTNSQFVGSKKTRGTLASTILDTQHNVVAFDETQYQMLSLKKGQNSWTKMGTYANQKWVFPTSCRTSSDSSFAVSISKDFVVNQGFDYTIYRLVDKKSGVDVQKVWQGKLNLFLSDLCLYQGQFLLTGSELSDKSHLAYLIDPEQPRPRLLVEVKKNQDFLNVVATSWGAYAYRSYPARTKSTGDLIPLLQSVDHRSELFLTGCFCGKAIADEDFLYLPFFNELSQNLELVRIGKDSFVFLGSLPKAVYQPIALHGTTFEYLAQSKKFDHVTNSYVSFDWDRFELTQEIALPNPASKFDV